MTSSSHAIEYWLRMSLVAIIGAGPLAGALAQSSPCAALSPRSGSSIAWNGRARQGARHLSRVRSSAADGAGPATDRWAAIGADVVVIADAADGSEHTGEAGSRSSSARRRPEPALLRCRRAARGDGSCACASSLASARVIGSAPRPWPRRCARSPACCSTPPPDEATLQCRRRPATMRRHLAGRHRLRAPLTTVMGAHEIAALTARVAGLWPPGPTRSRPPGPGSRKHLRRIEAAASVLRRRRARRDRGDAGRARAEG